MRLLREAQKGNPLAFERLLEPWIPGVWSICLAHSADQSTAVDRIRGFRAALLATLSTFTPETPFGLQLYTLLWIHLSKDLELSPPYGIPRVRPRLGRPLPPPTARDSERIRHAVTSAPPVPRLIYLFWLTTHLGASGLTQLTGLPEETIRQARTLVTVRIQEAIST